MLGKTSRCAWVLRHRLLLLKGHRQPAFVAGLLWHTESCADLVSHGPNEGAYNSCWLHHQDQPDTGTATATAAAAGHQGAVWVAEPARKALPAHRCTSVRQRLRAAPRHTRKQATEGQYTVCAGFYTHSQSIVRLPLGLCRPTLQMKFAKEPPCTRSNHSEVLPDVL